MQHEVGSGLRGHNSVVVIAGGIVGKVRRLLEVVVACGVLRGWVCAVAVPVAVVVQPLSVLRRFCCRNP